MSSKDVNETKILAEPKANLCVKIGFCGEIPLTDTQDMAKTAVEDIAVTQAWFSLTEKPKPVKYADAKRYSGLLIVGESQIDDIGYSPAWKLIQDMIQQGKIAAADATEYAYDNLTAADAAADDSPEEMDDDFSDDFRAAQAAADKVEALRAERKRQSKEAPQTHEKAPSSDSNDQPEDKSST